MKLVVGLGNPGPAYEGTRHNLGFLAARLLAEKLGLPRFRPSLRGLTSRAAVDGLGDVVILLPTTFMNESGAAVKAVLRRRPVAPGDLVIIHDDLDLPPGRLRVRLGGSSGGHRGVASVIERLGTDAFVRVRIGIGRPPGGVDPVDYVLERPWGRERDELSAAAALAAEAAKTVLVDGPESAMSRFNARPTKREAGPPPAAGVDEAGTR